jgi:hypothetical protein
MPNALVALDSIRSNLIASLYARNALLPRFGASYVDVLAKEFG